MTSLKLLLTKPQYFAPAFVFASINIILGTWAIYIPTIKEKLGIDEKELGIAIFFMALGTLILVILAPKLINRIGVGTSTFYGIIMFLAAFILPFSTSHYHWLCFGMFMVGATAGFTDVAMNALVSNLEKRYQVSIMSANHGFFSLGGFLGAGIGSFFLGKGLPPIHHLLIVIAIVLVVNLIFAKYYFTYKSIITEENTFKFKAIRPVIILGFIAFFILATEGAIIDWSALYLEKVSLAKLKWIGLGYTIFSATMSIGRFFGDGISQKMGSKTIILIGSLIGVLGFSLILLVTPIIVFIGFGFVGFGLSVIIPELYRLAGNTKNIDTSVAISYVSGIGFLGFLTGPVILGFLAELSSLKLSFLALLVFVVVAFFLTLTLKRKVN